MTSALWTVVLAAGSGRRLAEVTGGVPKQFWRPDGRTSLLDQTLDRFSPVAPASRTIAIVDAGHRPWVADGRLADRVDTLVFQPEDRGTAAGVLLGLLPLLASDPNAIVVVTPSDHGVADDGRFRQGVLDAVRRVQSRGDVVLFGVEAESPRSDYGWISTDGEPRSDRFRPVASFVEKPDAGVAARLLEGGALWNTMVVVARAGALADLFARLLPGLFDVFANALRLRPTRRGGFLAGAYPALPRHDFSRDILTHARPLSAYVWPASVGWSDLGTPDRLSAWQSRADVPRATALAAGSAA
jgi:mannose-1-phosphate guanylyltransferase